MGTMIWTTAELLAEVAAGHDISATAALQLIAAEREACAQLCDHRRRLQLTRAAAELNEHARERAAEAAGCAQDIRNRAVSQ